MVSLDCEPDKWAWCSFYAPRECAVFFPPIFGPIPLVPERRSWKLLFLSLNANPSAPSSPNTHHTSPGVCYQDSVLQYMSLKADWRTSTCDQMPPLQGRRTKFKIKSVSGYRLRETGMMTSVFPHSSSNITLQLNKQESIPTISACFFIHHSH